MSHEKPTAPLPGPGPLRPPPPPRPPPPVSPAADPAALQKPTVPLAGAAPPPQKAGPAPHAGTSVNPLDHAQTLPGGAVRLPVKVDLGPEGEAQDAEAGRLSGSFRWPILKPAPTHYRIQGELGRGGMAVVYRAFDRDLRRLVAMKVMNDPFDADPDLTSRFIQEAQATSQLGHPAIVPIHEIGIDEERRLFFAMRLVRGRTLARVIADLRAGDPETVHDFSRFRLLQVFVEVANAVSYAHERGLIHRDLKPQNIMIGRFGDVHVMDWGIAKLIPRKADGGDDDDEGRDGKAGARQEKHTPTGLRVDPRHAPSRKGEVWGTPGYAPPEQVIGAVEDMSPRSDVFALGAVLYFILTGHAPYEADDPHQIITKTLFTDPPRPRDLEPKVPRELDAICMKALAREPRDRYRSALALAEDAQAYLEGRSVSACPDPLPRRALKLAARHPLLMGGVAVALLVGVAAASFMVARLRTEHELFVREHERADAERQAAALSRARVYSEMGRRALDAREAVSAEVLFASSLRLDDTHEAREGLLEARVKGAGLVWRAERPPGSVAIAFSPAGTLVAMGGEDGKIRLLDSGTGAARRALEGHGGAVHALAFAPDGLRLASCGADEAVRIWDAETGKELRVLRGHIGPVHGLAFDPGGGRLASCGEDQTVRIWDAATWRETQVLRGHEALVYGVAFSPDGARLCSGAWDSTIRIWDLSTGREARVARSRFGWVYRVAFGAGGRLIAAGTDSQRVLVLDAASGAEVFALRGHDRAVQDVAFAPKSGRLASAGRDRTVRLWDLESGKGVTALRARGAETEGFGVAFSPDGRFLASGAADAAVQLWDLAPRKEAGVLEGHRREVWHADFSPDGRRIVSAGRDGTVRIWDAAERREARSLDAHAGGVAAAVFSADGRRIASCGADAAIRLWGAETGAEIAALTGHSGEVGSVAFSPDGRRLVSGGWDRTVRVWDLEARRERLKIAGHAGNVVEVAYSPDGRRIASASYDRTARVWDAETGAEVATLRGHRHYVETVAFSPDGARVATAGWDRTIRVWEVATGRELESLLGHTGSVYAVAFTADGRRLASGSEDGTVRVWDAEKWRPLFTLRGHEGEVIGVDFGGERLASASFDRTVWIWDLPAIGRFLAMSPGEICAQAERDTGLRIEGIEPAPAATRSP